MTKEECSVSIAIDNKGALVDKRGVNMAKKKEESFDLSIYDNKQVALSNALIQAREKTSLLESKIELLAIYRMSDDMYSVEKNDGEGNVYNVHAVSISSAEIRQLIGRKGGSLYTQIEAAALELKRKLFIYRNPGENQFVMKSLYGDVSYDGGRLTVEFNPDTESLFLDLKDNFTKLKLDIAFKFQTNGGFQLYKLLKSYSYTLKPIDPSLDQKSQDYIEKRYSLSELRLQLGYVDINQPDIQKEGAKKNPDVEKMAKMEKKPKYKRWADFKKRVLTPGINEVNSISDIYIDSIEKDPGAHGKVEHVIIRFMNNKNYYCNETTEEVNTPKVLTEEEVDEFIDDLRDMFNGLKTRDLKAIAVAANYDIDIISRQFDVLKTYKTHHSDVNEVAFMIAAIKKNYQKSSRTDNSFKNFDERDYDWSDFEDLL